MSKLLATVATIGFAALIAPPMANAHEQNAAGISNVSSTDISAVRRHHWRHYRHVWRYPRRHYYGYYGEPYYYGGPAYAYGYGPYYYRPGPRFYVGPFGFGIGF